MVVVRSNNQENIGLANILKNLVGNSKAFRLYFLGQNLRITAYLLKGRNLLD